MNRKLLCSMSLYGRVQAAFEAFVVGETCQGALQATLAALCSFSHIRGGKKNVCSWKLFISRGGVFFATCMCVHSLDIDVSSFSGRVRGDAHMKGVNNILCLLKLNEQRIHLWHMFSHCTKQAHSEAKMSDCICTVSVFSIYTSSCVTKSNYTIRYLFHGCVIYDIISEKWSFCFLMNYKASLWCDVSPIFINNMVLISIM